MADGELEYARVQDDKIDDAWGVFNDGDLVAVVDTETMAARLCAAEDMLDALRKVEAVLSEYRKTGRMDGWDLPLREARAAIEKATVSERECPHYQDNQGFCHKCGIVMCEGTVRDSGYWQEGMVEGK
jgi:hypothetical protein